MQSPSIRSLPSPRPTLHAYEVRAKITKADIETMARELETAFETQGTVDILILMTQWDGIELGAAFDGKALKAQAKASGHVRRYAVVGAPGWASAMINIFSPLTPVEEKTFDLAETDEAWRWVSA